MRCLWVCFKIVEMHEKMHSSDAASLVRADARPAR